MVGHVDLYIVTDAQQQQKKKHNISFFRTRQSKMSTSTRKYRSVSTHQLIRSNISEDVKLY